MVGTSRNAKVESFLLRRFSADEFNKIRCCESAIIDANGTLRFVVLTDRALYLVESPPKSIKLVLKFENVVSISFEHNYAPFLNGEDRENCQHIKVGFLREGFLDSINPQSSDGDSSGDDKSRTETIDRFLEARKSNVNFLHLYIRSKHSTFCSNFKNAIAGFMVRQTVALSLFKGHESSSIDMKPNQIAYLFNQLIQDIMQSEDMMDSFIYYRELHVAATRSFVVKKRFWKNWEFVEFLIDQLKQLTLNSSVNVNHPQAIPSRCDEIQVSSLITEIFAEMLRETELVSERMDFLQANEFTLSRKLIKLCLSCPLLPESFQRPAKTRGVAHIYDKSINDAKNSNFSTDEELLLHYCNYFLCSQSLIFEFLITAIQIKWIDASCKFDIGWLLNELEKNADFKPFLQTIIWLAMVILDTTVKSKLTAQQSLWVYQIFGLVQNVLEYSKNLATYFRSEFREEFKYFFVPNVVKRRLDISIPISANILGKVNSLQELVIEQS